MAHVPLDPMDPEAGPIKADDKRLLDGSLKAVLVVERDALLLDLHRRMQSETRHGKMIQAEM